MWFQAFLGGRNKLPWQLSKRICLQGNHAVLLKSEMHNTVSTWRFSLKGMCTGKSEIFYKFKLMKHSCWFANVSQGNYSAQRQELNNLAMYMCNLKLALCWTDLVYQPLFLCFASTRSLSPSIYKLPLTQMVIKSEPEIFNPLYPFFFWHVVSVNIFLPAAAVISMCCREGDDREDSLT